jgi:hypothetical protein
MSRKPVISAHRNNHQSTAPARCQLMPRTFAQPAEDRNPEADLLGKINRVGGDNAVKGTR